MPYRKRVRVGDVIAVPLVARLVVAGLVLHKSRHFPTAIIVGFYRRTFPTPDAIDITALDGPFIAPPNYTWTGPIWHEHWRVVGNSPVLLAATMLPVLRVVATLYQGDTVVGQATPETLREYPEARFAYQGFVEERLREYFATSEP